MPESLARLPASLQSRVTSRSKTLDTRHHAYTTTYKRSSSVWPMLILLALLSENSDDEQEIRALKTEVAQLRQSMSTEEQGFVTEVASQEGYVLPDAVVVIPKPSLGDGDRALAPVEAEPRPSIQANLASSLDSLGINNEDPVQGIFSLFGMLFPLMFAMFGLIVVKNMFRDS